MNEFDVIILGAGAAGAGAYFELRNTDLSIGVIEARDRIGGRVYSEPYGNGHIEYGAEFIHLLTDNFKTLLDANHIDYQPTNPKSVVWKKQSKTIEPISNIFSVMEDLYSNLDLDQKDLTISEAIKTLPKNQLNDEELSRAIDFMQAYYAADLDKASIQFAMCDEGDEVNRKTVLPYHNFIKEIFAEQSQNLNIFLNTNITEINWQDGEVVLKSEDGQSFKAKKLIITVPVSILKAAVQGQGLKFIPSLTDEKIQALSSFEMGQVHRVNMVFTNDIFKENFSFLYSPHLAFNCWLRKDIDEHVILSAWAGGNPSINVNHLDKHDIEPLALNNLAEIVAQPKDKIAEQCKDIKWHDWNHDPFSMGAYSYIKPHHGNITEALIKPLNETLFFAGEATSPAKHLGTVHGAINSGIRAAKESLS